MIKRCLRHFPDEGAVLVQNERISNRCRCLNGYHLPGINQGAVEIRLQELHIKGRLLADIVEDIGTSHVATRS